MIDLVPPKSIICKNTRACMQAGIIYGFAGLVENIVKKIKDELGDQDVQVVATGGMGEVIAKEVSCINKTDRMLTLEGLKRIYDMNK